MTLPNHKGVYALGVLNIALALLWVYLAPEGAIVWGAGALFLPAAVLCAAFQIRQAGPKSRAIVERSLFGAGLMIFASLLTSGLIVMDALPENLALRFIGVAIGIAVIITGNRLPKDLTPLSEQPNCQTACDARGRTVARVQFLSGVGTVLTSLALPADYVPFAMLGWGLLTVCAVIFTRFKRMESDYVQK